MNTEKPKTLEILKYPGGMQCRVVRLTAAYTTAIAALHGGTIDNLDAAEKSFMFGKSANEFTAHFMRGAGNTVIGVMRQRELIAQALIRHPTAAYTTTGMVDMTLPAAPEKLSIMQAVSVAPAWRGLGLMDAMVRQWIDYAADHGRTDLLAEIHVANSASWSCFLRAGLSIVSIGRDPDDGVIVYNAHGKIADIRGGGALRDTFNSHACAPADLTTQSALMQQGYAITARDPVTKAVILTQPLP